MLVKGATADTTWVVFSQSIPVLARKISHIYHVTHVWNCGELSVWLQRVSPLTRRFVAYSGMVNIITGWRYPRLTYQISPRWIKRLLSMMMHVKHRNILCDNGSQVWSLEDDTLKLLKQNSTCHYSEVLSIVVLIYLYQTDCKNQLTNTDNGGDKCIVNVWGSWFCVC